MFDDELDISLGTAADFHKNHAEDTHNHEDEIEEGQEGQDSDLEDPSELDDIGNLLSEDDDEEGLVMHKAGFKANANRNTQQASKGKNGTLDLLIKDLKDIGLPLDIKDDEKVEDTTAFLTKVQGAINTLAQQKLDDQFKNFSSAKKMFLEIENGVDDEVQAMRVVKAHEHFNTLNDAAIDADENIAIDLNKRYYFSKGMTKAEVDEQIELLQTQNKLYEKAKAALPQLKAQTQNYIEAAKQKAADAAKPENDPFITKATSLLDDEKSFTLNIPKDIREAAKKSMTTPIKVGKNGEALNSIAAKQTEDPEGFEALLHVYDQMGLFDRDGDKFTPNIKKLTMLVQKKVEKNLDKVIGKAQRLENMTSGFDISENANVEDNLAKFRKLASKLQERFVDID